jgi:predicted HTH domain antitoxin
MPLVIDDQTLREVGLTEAEARLELACRLFETGRLDLWPAARLAGLSKLDFAFELGGRGIDAFRYGPKDLDDDLETLDEFLKTRDSSHQ